MSEGRVIVGHMIRDEVLTRYVRHLIQEWTDNGRTLVELERAAGAKSSGHFTQIRSGKLGASERVVQYMARAFNKTPKQIRDEAYEYERVHPSKEEDTFLRDIRDPQLRIALDFTKKANTDPGAVSKAVQRWRDMIGKGMPWDWWANRIGDEQRTLDLGTRARERVQRKDRIATTRKAAKTAAVVELPRKRDDSSDDESAPEMPPKAR